jgi:hypothetical protein
MQVDLVSMQRLWFGPGDPVRAASGVARFGDGWLVAQDDATHAGWWRPGAGTVGRIRLLPASDGQDVFGEADGTKRLKPDLEAACTIPASGAETVLLLGSGSLPPRTRGVLVRGRPEDGFDVRWSELAALYERVGEILGLDATGLNLEGACVVGERLRWFQRGHGPAGIPSASVDLPWRDLVAVVDEGGDPAAIGLGGVRRYDLGALDGLALAITDAVVLDDGRVCVSATAEDAPDAVEDGPVTGSVLALLGDGPDEVQVLPLPEEVAGCKVEGLGVLAGPDGQVGLLAVVDEDDPAAASLAIELALTEGEPR